jgi:hypothetical protein
MDCAHDTNHQAAEHQSLARVSDFMPMVLRQFSLPHSHCDCHPVHSDTITAHQQQQ